MQSKGVNVKVMSSVNSRLNSSIDKLNSNIEIKCQRSGLELTQDYIVMQCKGVKVKVMSRVNSRLKSNVE